MTAVFVANDEMALGVMRAMFEAGREVPGDVSIVGFDDVPFARYLTPPLTTVRQDFEEIGRRSVHLLLNAIDGVDDARRARGDHPGAGRARQHRPGASSEPDRRGEHAVVADDARLAGEPERALRRGCPRSRRRSSRGSPRARTTRRRSTPVNDVRSACRVKVTRARSPGSSVDAREAGELDHRPGDLGHRVGEVELDDLGARAVALVAHHAGHLQLAVGGDLVGAHA